MSKKKNLIYEELSKVVSHPTADEIYEMVRKKDPRISLGTVYRNLEQLVQEGKVLKLDSGSGPRRYDARANNHYHIRCIKCGKVEDVTYEPNPEIDNIAKDNSKYKVLGHILEFYGLCPDCQNDSKKGQE